MTVLGTVDEINKVLRHFNPNYPRQSLQNIETNSCFYVLNGVPVEILIRRGTGLNEEEVNMHV